MSSNDKNGDEENNLQMRNLNDSDLESMIIVGEVAEDDVNKETSPNYSIPDSIDLVSLQSINQGDLESPTISSGQNSFVNGVGHNSDIKTPPLLDLDMLNSDSELSENGTDLKQVAKTNGEESDPDVKVLEEESINPNDLELDITLSYTDDPNLHTSEQNNPLEQLSNAQILINRFWIVSLILRMLPELQKCLKVKILEEIKSAKEYLLMDLINFLSTDDKGDVKNLTFKIFQNYDKYSELLKGKDWNQCFQFIGDVMLNKYPEIKGLIFGSYKTNYECPSCQEKSSKFAEKCSYTLNLKDKDDYSNIDDVINENLNPFVDDKCGKCNKKLNCVVEIQSAPRYLVLSFKRFDQNKWLANTFHTDDGYVVRVNGKDTLFSLKGTIDFQLSDRVYMMKYRGDDLWMEYGMDGTSICSEYNIISSKTLAVLLEKID